MPIASGEFSPGWKGDQVGYQALHCRIRKARGKASQHKCSAECGRQAYDWAQIHTESGFDVWADYVPLCRRCHIAYDRRGKSNRPSPDGIARISAAQKGHKEAPEVTEKRRQKLLGRKQSPESIEKRRIANTGRQFTPQALENIRAAAKTRASRKGKKE
jgi:hypothetical protein